MKNSLSSFSEGTESEHSLLVITALNGKRLSKTLDADLNKISDYDAGYKLRFESHSYFSFHDLLHNLFEVGGETAFLLSRPTKFLEAELEVGHLEHRRLLKPHRNENDGQATVSYRDGVELSLAAVFKIVVTVSFMRPEPAGWPLFPG